VETLNPIGGGRHHEILLSNFFAQPEALAFGKDEQAVKKVTYFLLLIAPILSVFFFFISAD
jgi:glucose-6-phosphate isomerase